MNISLLPGTTPMYPKHKNKKTPANIDRSVFICTLPVALTRLPNSRMVNALTRANRTVNEIGPPKIHPTNTATKIMPVIVRCKKLFFMVSVCII